LEDEFTHQNKANVEKGKHNKQITQYIQMKKQFIMANIKIPIEVDELGKIIPMQEYINIDFSLCNELPEKKTTPVDYSFFSESLNDAISKLLPVSTMMVTYDEIRHKKQKRPKNNITFKRGRNTPSYP